MSRASRKRRTRKRRPRLQLGPSLFSSEVAQHMNRIHNAVSAAMQVSASSLRKVHASRVVLSFGGMVVFDGPGEVYVGPSGHEIAPVLPDNSRDTEK